MRTSQLFISADERCSTSHKMGRPEGASSGDRARAPRGTWAHLVGLVADPTAEGLPSDVGHHVPLQHGRGAEDLPTRRAGVVLLGVHLVDVLAVVLQSGEAHPALLAVVGVFYVWFHERKARGKTPQAAVSHVWEAVHSSRHKALSRGHARSQTPRTRSQYSDHLTTPYLHPQVPPRLLD